MTTPIATVVRIAATPAEAKVLAARLQAEGIPAHVDGDSLSDEVAVSRRLMNLNGTRVMVPTASLERAREILASEVCDAAELEQQALAASDPERAPAPVAANGARGANPLLWPFVGASALALVFFVLWFDYVDLHASTKDPLFDFVPRGDGVAESVRRSDGAVVARWHDENGNRIWDRQDTVVDGRVVSSAFDTDQDGHWERLVTKRAGGWTETWTDGDRDGVFELGVITDAKGVVQQRITWKPEVGFVTEKP